MVSSPGISRLTLPGSITRWNGVMLSYRIGKNTLMSTFTYLRDCRSFLMKMLNLSMLNSVVSIMRLSINGLILMASKKCNTKPRVWSLITRIFLWIYPVT